MPGDNFFIHTPCDLLPVRYLKQVEGSLVHYEITCGQLITRWIRSIVFSWHLKSFRAIDNICEAERNMAPMEEVTETRINS